MFTHAVAHTGQLGNQLRVGSEADVPRIHGVLKGKGAFELAKAYGEVLVFGPFTVGIHNAYTLFIGFAHATAGHLHLQAVFKVEHLTVDVGTGHAQVEAAVCRLVLVCDRGFTHYIASEGSFL